MFWSLHNALDCSFYAKVSLRDLQCFVAPMDQTLGRPIGISGLRTYLYSSARNTLELYSDILKLLCKV